MWIIWPRKGNAVPICYTLGRNVLSPPVIGLRSGEDWRMVWGEA